MTPITAEIHNENKLSYSLADPDFILILAITLFGVITKMTRSQEQITLRMMLGELMLAAMMAVFLYFVGLYEGLSNIQIVLIAVPASLGNARLLKYLLHFAQIGKMQHPK
jgi:multidrug efflux pump subunit AcrB